MNEMEFIIRCTTTRTDLFLLTNDNIQSTVFEKFHQNYLRFLHLDQLIFTKTFSDFYIYTCSLSSIETHYQATNQPTNQIRNLKQSNSIKIDTQIEARVLKWKTCETDTF